MRARLITAAPWIAIAALALALAAPLFNNPFVYDDPVLVGQHPTFLDLLRRPGLLLSDLGSGFASPMRVGYFRPLQTLALAEQRLFFGGAAAPYRVCGALLHMLSSLLVLGLARGLLQRNGPALLAAAWFAAHPAHVDDLALVSNQGGLLAATLVLTALLLTERSLVRPARGRLLRGLAALAVLAAALAKETALVAPLAMGLLVWARSRDEQPWRRLRAALLVAAVPTLAIALVLALRLWSADVGLPRSPAEPAWLRPLAAPLWIGRGLLHGLLPWGLSADYGLRWWPDQGAAWKLAAGWAATLGLLIAGRRWAGRGSDAARCAGLGLLLYVLLYLPTSNLAPMPRALADHYLYLPSAGLALAWGALLLRLKERRPLVANLAAGAVLLCWLALGWNQAEAWSSEGALWTRCAKFAPGSSSAWNGLGIVQADAGDLERSRSSLERAVELDPANYRAWGNLGLLDLRVKNNWGALGHFQRALAVNPAYDNALLGVGYSAELSDAGLVAGLAQRYSGSFNGPYVWGGAALACRDSGDRACAGRMIEKFFEAEPPSRYMKRELAELYQRTR